MTSANNTVISRPGQSIIDAAGNVWAITGGQVKVNGVVDPTTQNVIEVAYENGTIWQKNTDNLWWGKASVSALWEPPFGTPVDPIPNQVASANDTIVTVIPGMATASITDISGNVWSISGGKVTLDGVADPTTANVVELAFVNGKIWQENTSNLWWSKSKPSDTWGPANGIPTSPAAHTARTWNGANATFATPADWTPNGVPQAGDTAVIGSGQVSVTPGFGNGVNFALSGGEMAFNVSGTFNTGTWSGSGVVVINYPGQNVIVTTAGITMNGGEIDIREFSSFANNLTIRGNSRIAGGAVLTDHFVGTGGLPYAPIENDGTMTIIGSTVAIGGLSGHGTIVATSNSSLSVLSASASETIQLMSAHLFLEGTPLQTSNALQFLAPITNFGASSQITISDTQATSATFTKLAPTAGEMFVYNGAVKVADVHISGQAQIYASLLSNGGVPSVLLTPYDTGHSLPPTNS